VENQGRRVYDDLTAIDWIYEYTKERSRKRRLKEKGGGIMGWARGIWDDSQIWLVLVGTGLGAGLVAGMIDIVSLWLGDVKEGICETRFYLSKGFCCWGVDGQFRMEREVWVY
jgi:chloride channel 3/4/5